jgi:hypothetical protein
MRASRGGGGRGFGEGVRADEHGAAGAAPVLPQIAAQDIQRHIAAKAVPDQDELGRSGGKDRIGHLFHRLALRGQGDVQRMARAEMHDLRQEHARIAQKARQEENGFRHSPRAQSVMSAMTGSVWPGLRISPAMTWAKGSSSPCISRVSARTGPPHAAMTGGMRAGSIT